MATLSGGDDGKASELAVQHLLRSDLCAHTKTYQMGMTDWLSTAINTYLLHVEHSNGYQWWSGFGGRTFGVGTITAPILGMWWHTHNCHHDRCVRIGRHQHPDHGLLCRKHYITAGGQIPGKHYKL